MKTSLRIWHSHLSPQTLDVEHIFFFSRSINPDLRNLSCGFFWRELHGLGSGPASRAGNHHASRNFRGGGSEEIHRYQFHPFLSPLGVRQSPEARGGKLGEEHRIPLSEAYYSKCGSGPTLSASPESSWEMQNLRPHLRPLESEFESLGDLPAFYTWGRVV